MKYPYRSLSSAVWLVLVTFGGPVGAQELTAQNWTEMAAFKPDLTTVPVQKGQTITAGNVKEFEAVLPPAMKLMVEKYKMTMRLRDYEPIHPSQGYIAATNKYRGKTKILDVGADYRKKGIQDYVAGLPFPNPQNGLEVAWNYQYAYNGDDGDTYYHVYWVSASSGVEHKEEWRWAFIIRTINRTDIPPIPAIQSFLDKGLQYTSITYALAPYDKKGFGALYSRSVEPLDQQGHIYVPAMRRVLRNTFGTRGDTWNSTDFLYEDVRGYMGYPEWMEWKLVAKKTLLMPMHSGVKLGKQNHDKTYDFKNWPHWNPNLEYELRPVYVLEVIPKFADYPYKKQTIYVDAETFVIPFKECYDKKGELWKINLNGWSAPPDMNSRPPEFAMGLVVDFQAEHATAIAFNEVKTNTGLDPNLFTLSNLRKRGR